MLCPAAAEQKQAQKSARHPDKSLCLLYLFWMVIIHRVETGWIATLGRKSQGSKSEQHLGTL